MSTVCTRCETIGAAKAAVAPPQRPRHDRLRCHDTHSCKRYRARVTGGDRTGRSTGGSSDSVAAARGTAALAVSQVATRVLGLGFVLAATRALAPAELGRYAVAAALLVGASTIADLGTTSVVTKLVSQEPSRSSRIVGAVVLPSLLLGLLSLAALLAFVVVSGYPTITRLDSFIVGIGLPADAVLTSLLGGFDGRGLLTRRARLSTLRTLLTVGGGFVGILVTGDVVVALVALGLGPNIALAAAVVAARRHGVWTGRARIDPDLLRVVARLALPFALLGGINVIFLRADVIILSLLTDPSEVARYDVALRATEALGFLGTMVAAPSLFILSRRLGANDVPGAQRAFDEAVRLAYLLGLPLSAVLVALGEPVAIVVFGDQYRAAGTLLAILGLQLWLAVIAAIQGSLLLAGGSLRRAVQLFGALAAVGIAIEVFAISLAGATGAAAAMVVLQTLIVAAAAMFSRRHTGVVLHRPAAGAVAAALASAGTMAASADRWLPLSLFIGGVVYVAVLALTRTVDVADVRRLATQVRADR